MWILILNIFTVDKSRFTHIIAQCHSSKNGTYLFIRKLWLLNQEQSLWVLFPSFRLFYWKLILRSIDLQRSQLKSGTELMLWQRGSLSPWKPHCEQRHSHTCWDSHRRIHLDTWGREPLGTDTCSCHDPISIHVTDTCLSHGDCYTHSDTQTAETFGYLYTYLLWHRNHIHMWYVLQSPHVHT